MAISAQAATVPDIAKEVATKLQIDELRVRSPQAELLKGVSLSVRRGEILSIIGPAGAGKTTFLRALNRMNDLEPDLQTSGDVLLDGHPIYGPGVDVALLRRKVGMVFSVPVPLPMTISRTSRLVCA